MSYDQSKIIRSLAQVKDPNRGQDILSLSMVRDVQIEGQLVNVKLETTALDSMSKANLNGEVVAAIQSVYPELEVNVHMITQSAMGAPGTGALPQVKNIIAVASGKGGVGKSTVSVNLAMGLKSLGATVGLLDADVYGPSMPTMLGLQGRRPQIQTVNNKPRLLPLQAHGIPVMSIGFIIEPEQAVVLRGPRLAGIIKQFVQDCTWPALDYLIVDLPPGTGDVQLTLVQTVPVTGAVIVTTPQEVAVADAIKAANMFLLPSVNVPILGVVENMSWFTPAELPDNKYYLFGKGGGEKMAKFSESMLLGQVPLVQSVREGGDAGRPIFLNEEDPSHPYWKKIAENTVRQVALRNEAMGPTQVVKMQS